MIAPNEPYEFKTKREKILFYGVFTILTIATTIAVGYTVIDASLHDTTFTVTGKVTEVFYNADRQRDMRSVTLLVPTWIPFLSLPEKYDSFGEYPELQNIEVGEVYKFTMIRYGMPWRDLSFISWEKIPRNGN